MDIEAQLETLSKFVRELPLPVVNALADRNLDIITTVYGIGSEHGLVMQEMGRICEGMSRVLAGEESPSSFLPYIEEDSHVEEDNRGSLPMIASEIQEKVFDSALAILKDAGFDVIEGRVPVQPTTEKVVSPYAPVESPIDTIRQMEPLRPTGPTGQTGQPPLDEKNMRALLRIAAGTEYTEGQLRDAFEALPQGLRQSISSVDTANAVQDIAKKYLLHVDQMAALASETGLVLLGLTHPADFIGNLAKRLRLPDERARDIAKDISAEVLVKVREALRGLHEKPTTDNPAYAEASAGRRQPTTGKEEPPRKLNVMPRPTLQSQSPVGQASPLIKGVPPSEAGRVVTTPALAEAPTELSRMSSDTPFAKGDVPKVNTPFSAGARWNTGDNILKQQAEDKLSREAVLRGIENPAPVDPRLPPSNVKLETKVGPTGWKPSGNTISSDLRNLAKYPINKIESPPQTSPLEKGNTSTTTSRESGVAFPPPEQFSYGNVTARPKPKPEPQDFLEQKLQEPTALPKEEKRYTSDPYREPLA